MHLPSQKLAKRAVSYVAAFALSFINILILGLVTWAGGEYNSIFTLYVNFFYPLHGLYNLIVFLWPKVMQLREDNETSSLLQIISIAFRTYNRGSLIPLSTNEGVTSRNCNTTSSSRNRISLSDWIGRSFRYFVRQSLSAQNGSSGQNTQKRSDMKDVNECTRIGLNTLCQPFNDSDRLSEGEGEGGGESNGQDASCHLHRHSDGISFSESENDCPNTSSCQSLKNFQADGLSVGESESEKSSV